jgi:ribosomal protein S18 acetylase RimI-like enzyme
MNHHSYSRARAEDSAAYIELRGQTRQNAFSSENLAALGITPESWGRGITDKSLTGHVCEAGSRMVGYCFGSMDTGEILVLAVLPEHEGKGIARRLLQNVMDDLFRSGFSRLFLACSSDPESRSHGFYRHLGWKSTEILDANKDEILEFVSSTSHGRESKA